MKKYKMNGYIKLFNELSKLKPSQMVDKSAAEKFGFFITDLELLHDEKYIFLEKSGSISKTKYDIKLAPRGFSSLEEYFKERRYDARNRLLRDSTIVLTLAATLGILFQIGDKFGAILKAKMQEIPVWISGFFWVLIAVFILLFVLKTINIIFSRESWKGIFFDED